MSGENQVINVRVWGENIHEKMSEAVREIYPDGMHEAIAELIREGLGDQIQVATATLDQPEHGLTEGSWPRRMS